MGVFFVYFLMARYRDVEEQMASLNIEEEENESFVFEGDVEEDVNRYELCLVGRFLTEKNINIRAMKSKMADVWKPAMGVNIKELEQGIFLVQFYHKEDMQWVANGGPWMFDNVMMVLESIAAGEEPLKVPLWHLKIWMQIHDLPMGFMSEAVGKQLGNFFGEFIQYDAKNNTSIWRECMRVRIRLDVRKPLKRKKKILKKDGTEITVSCKYERLGEFCFSCGLVTHTDRFCRKFIDRRGEEGGKAWGGWLRAPPRRAAGQGQSKWLRDEEDATWESRIGRATNFQNLREENILNKGKEIRKESDCRELAVADFQNKNVSTNYSINANLAGFQTNSNILYGLNEEDPIGLILDDRKRRRSGSDSNGVMDVDGGLIDRASLDTKKYSEAAISGRDLAASSTIISAELALQASRSQ